MANVGDVASGTAVAQVVLPAPGQGKRWYLKDLVYKGDTAGDLTVQSPANTNLFKAHLSENEGFEKEWSHPGKPGAENQAMVIDFSAGGTYSINYEAVVR